MRSPIFIVSDSFLGLIRCHFYNSLPRVKIVILSLCLCTGLPFRVSAQTTVPPFRPEQVTRDSSAVAQRQDTIFALQRFFFEQRRTGRATLVKGSLATAVFSALFAWQNPPTTTYQEANRVVTIGFIGFGVGQLVRGTVRCLTYRGGRETALIATLEQGQPLPRAIRKRLTAKYFPTPTTTQ